MTSPPLRTSDVSRNPFENEETTIKARTLVNVDEGIYQLSHWTLWSAGPKGTIKRKCHCQVQDQLPVKFDKISWLRIVTYLHIEDALYAQKSVSSWFLAVFDSKINVCWNLKKLSILWYTKFQLITVKYHEVKALFCKMSRHVEKLGSLHTKCQYQVTVLGTAPVLEIGTILLHLNGRNFLIPYPRELVDP